MFQTLKHVDVAAGCQNKSLQNQIAGAPNFRQVTHAIP